MYSMDIITVLTDEVVREVESITASESL